MQRPLQQHDLHSQVAERLVKDCRLPSDATILEVGPGTGQLTHCLLQQGCRVAAVELDSKRAQGLRERFAKPLEQGQFQLLVGDATELMPDLPKDWQVVANPPFQHSAELLRRWLLEDLPSGPPAGIHLVLQDQTARKYCGDDEGQTRTSVLCRLFGKPHFGRRLKRDDVQPPSRVPLRFWSLKRASWAASPHDLRLVDSLLERGFAGPHTIREALRQVSTPAILKRQAGNHGYKVDDHPRSLNPESWLDLARFLREVGKI